ncbi:SagB family peptide dehydrogenase, partial [Kitasatospora sp. NPDC058965]|uniref:SagB family peptide dehydrogenase n=1 Tax=Kitasatospora sp. NPDC058965 TaxID=3346682 RepID=UPI003684BC8E
SALTGDGVGELRDCLGQLTSERRAAARRIGADLDAAADLPDGAGLPAAVVPELVELLVAAGAVGVLDGAGRLPEEADPVAAQREFHDVLAHWHSRRGFSGLPIGATFPFRERYAPPAAVKPVTGPVIALPEPDPDLLQEQDPPLAAVMEGRRSVRRYGTGSLTLGQLGEFLHRTVRVRREVPANDAVPYDWTRRPVPSAGGGHDLELYLAVTRCRGLAPGIYHYEPVPHGLTLVTADRSAVLDQVRNAATCMGERSVPQVVVILAARFNRLSWKYRGLAYTAGLKNVGVLYEAMYLAATAMRLGGCGLGNGDSAAFAELTGLDPLEESSVGEFALGIPAEE